MNYALNSLSYSLPETLQTAVQASLDEWQENDKINRLWQKDASIWTNDDEAKWLDWLDVVGVELADISSQLQALGPMSRSCQNAVSTP